MQISTGKLAPNVVLTCLLNFSAALMYLSSLGLTVLTAPLTGLEAKNSSRRICGLAPLARQRSFLSFRANHRFLPDSTRSSEMANLPKNSNLEGKKK